MAVHLREPGRRGTDSGGVLRGVSPCHGRPSPGGGNRRDRPLCRPPIAGRPHRRRGAAARQPPQDPRPPLARRGGPGHHHPPGLGACPLVSPPRSSAGGRAGARLPRGDVHLRRLERDALFQWEVKDPGRDIPRAMALGVVAIMAIYLVLNLTFLHLVPLGRMAGEPLVAGAAAEAAVRIRRGPRAPRDRDRLTPRVRKRVHDDVGPGPIRHGDGSPSAHGLHSRQSWWHADGGHRGQYPHHAGVRVGPGPSRRSWPSSRSTSS